MSDSVIRVLIADDHLIIREGLRLIIDTADDIEIVAEAADGLEAVRLAAGIRPDVVLMDLRMPRLDGLAALEELRRDNPEQAVIVLTTFNEDELMRRALELGARGFLLKDTDRLTLFENIRAAASGKTLINPEILSRALAGQAPSSARGGNSDLTARELEILRAVADGSRSKEIAWELGITERTVKAHLSSIYGKLGVDSRAAAAAEAGRRGLL